MSPASWERVKDLFHSALERTPEERLAFLARACGGDTELRTEVERLLTAHAQASSFMDQSPVAIVNASDVPRNLSSAKTGQVLGRYEIGRLIGVGGMGKVYEARDVDLRRNVAVKVAIAGDAEAHARLRREAQHASQLNHPHICTIHEVGTFDGQPYIVMEYVEGQRLSDLIPSQGLPIETALRYAIQIADALAHAHRSGVIHRDLKSANVVITPDGRAKVLDFGLARGLPSQRLKELSQGETAVTAHGVVAGTLSYLAPERLRGKDGDARSDIWSFGVLLYELAGGVRPFTGSTGFELSAAILREPPAPLPARIPSSLQQIIRRCLAKDLHERYGQAEEIRSALETVHAEVAAGTSHAPVDRAIARFVRSRRAAMVLLAVMLVLGVGVALTWPLVRPAGSAVAMGASGRPAIAVMNFESVSGATDKDIAWLSSGVPSMLLTGLAQTRGLEIVSPQRLHDAIKQLGKTNLESLDRGEVAAVARRAGAGAIVVGNIFRSGNEIRIDAQLEDLASGRVLFAETVRGTDVFVLVDQLAARVRGGIGFRDATGIRSVSDMSTASLEAFQLYSQGVDAYINTRFDDAQKLLESAVAIDPTFADAYLYLAHVNYFRGFSGLQQEYLRKAAEHAARLNERQRLILEAESAREAGNSTSAARVIDELIEKFPDVDEAYAMALRLYQEVTGIVYDPEKLLAITAAGAAALPNSMLTRDVYGYALLGAGRYAEALREFEAYTRVAPREPNPYDSLGELYLVMGAPDRAIESYARALTVDPNYSGSHFGRAWSLAALGRYDDAIAEGPPAQVRVLVLSRAGRYREADEAIEAGRRDAEIRENAEEQGDIFLVSSLLEIERKDYTRALQDCGSAERMFARLPEGKKRVSLVILHLMYGIAQAGAGRTDQARSHLETQQRLVNAAVEAENWWHKALEGEIALASGDLRKAATAFSAGQPSRRMWFSAPNASLSILANNLVSRDGLARVAKARGDLTGAIQIYRQLLSHGPEQKWVSVFEPRYVLEIARLLDQTGDKAGARQEYQRFLDIWKNADSGLPGLAQARQALGR